jgi:DNA-binding NtrC family response regulator
MDWSEKFRDLDDALWEPERAILLGALKAYGWNRKTTAQRLGINRTTLYKKMKRLGIESVN